MKPPGMCIAAAQVAPAESRNETGSEAAVTLQRLLCINPRHTSTFGAFNYFERSVRYFSQGSKSDQRLFAA